MSRVIIIKRINRSTKNPSLNEILFENKILDLNALITPILLKKIENNQILNERQRQVDNNTR